MLYYPRMTKHMRLENSSSANPASTAVVVGRRFLVPGSTCSGESAGDGTAALPIETGPRLVGQWLPVENVLDRIASVTGASRETVEELVKPLVQKLMSQADMVARSQEIIPWLDAVAIAAEDCSEDEMELINGLVRLRGELARTERG